MARRKRLLRRQRLMGLTLAIICIAVIVSAVGSATAADRDVTAVLLFAPLAVKLLTSKKIIIYG